jgi:hypothetical protein
LANPALHAVIWHVPPLHAVLAAFESEQVLPHVPQLPGSVFTLTHEPPQFVRPA